jgi:hypothetical protein
MEVFMTEKGAGYSIEVVLAAVILFTFAYGAVQVPEQKDWSGFQHEIAAQDLGFTLKKTGDLRNSLENSNPEALSSAVRSISSRNLEVSGTVENLPLGELSVGFHTMPGEIHQNFTEPVQPGDKCYGDLTEIEANSEYEILKTNASQYMEDKHGVRLYFADTDARVPGGYNGEEDYDAVWVDNGTRCVFSPSEGPYLTGEIFLWGNKTDSDPETHYEFKQFNESRNSFTVYKADRAADFQNALSRPVNGIDTDTEVSTFNFSSSSLENLNLIVFQENETLDRIETYEDEFMTSLSNSSVLFLMNLSESDLQKDFMQDIGFSWMNVDYTSSSPGYDASFSDYTVSEEIETYFQGLGGSVQDVSLNPGGNVISGQGPSFTSRDDVLYARNLAYDVSSLDGTEVPGTEVDIGGTCDSTRSEFDFPDGDRDVRILDLADSGSCDNVMGVEIREGVGIGDWRGPYLEGERVTVDGYSYIPEIEDEHSAVFEFAGSRRVELVNHRRVLENATGGRVARAAYEEDYSTSDIRMISSVIYWLRGDQIQFRNRQQDSSVSTTLVGSIDNDVYLPYKLNLRWSD